MTAYSTYPRFVAKSAGRLHPLTEDAPCRNDEGLNECELMFQSSAPQYPTQRTLLTVHALSSKYAYKMWIGEI
jgi:hypothetical protein